jgi:hypothetical protein
MLNLPKLVARGSRKNRRANFFPFACLAVFCFLACTRSGLTSRDGAVHVDDDAAPDAGISAPCRWLGFWPQVTYPALGEPTWLTVADFDRDGRPDIAVSISDKDVVGIYRNLGAGSFASQTPYSGVTAPNGIASADFDGDGFPDLAVTGGATAPHSIAVFTNRRDGSLASPHFYDIDASGSRAGFLAAGDLNGDGHLDLVATSYSTSTIAVFLNDGNGTLLPATTISLSHANRLSLGDLDGDGALDLAVAGSISTETFTPLLNDGHGKFRVGSPHSGPESGCCFIDLLAGKFGGKGTDVFAAGAHSLAFFANDGHGQFDESGKSVYTGASLAAADFNRDGVLDLAVVAETAVWLMLSPGDGQLRDPDYSFALGSSPRGIATGDFDGDGYPDVVVANADSKTISVLLSRCELDESSADAQ